MIIVTGAFGFIGSCLIGFLNEKGITDIVAVDDFSKTQKEPNLAGKKIAQRIERIHFIDWFKKNTNPIEFIFHIGARTDTTEFDTTVFEKLNIQYSKDIFNICIKHSIPIIYASSAATYGNGELGYSDTPQSLSFDLKPLNPYGYSKNDFDKWVLETVGSQQSTVSSRQSAVGNKESKLPTQILPTPFWAGLKFFNVYGPNEYHKGRMASTIFHFFNQINQKGEVNLFKSHRPEFKDGEQMRDFIYVKDVLNVIWFLYKNHKTTPSGIYNLGTGKARTFNDLVTNVFKNIDKPMKINYIPTPKDIRDTYQYFTEADMKRLTTEGGYAAQFHSLEEGIEDYIQNYLKPNRHF